MTIEQFGAKIKSQYPEYNDLPDAVIGQKMLVKYPQYNDMVTTATVPKPDLFGQTAKSTAQKIGATAGGLIGGVTEFAGGITKAAGKVLDLADQYNPISGASFMRRVTGQPSPDYAQKITEPVGSFLQQKGKVGTKSVGELLQSPKTASSSEWVGREILGPVLTMSAVTKAMPALEVAKDAPKALRMAMGTAKFVGKSVAESEIQRAGSTGAPATMQDLGVGLVLDAALGVASATLKKLGGGIFRHVAVNPDDVASEGMIKKAQQAVQERYVGTARMMKNQAIETIQKAGKELDDLFSDQSLVKASNVLDVAEQAEKLGQRKTVTGLLKAAKGGSELYVDTTRAQFVKKALEIADAADNIGDTSVSNSIRNVTKKFVAAGENAPVSAKEALQLKRQLSKHLSSFFDSPTALVDTQAAKKQAFFGLWSEIDNALNRISPKVAELNSKMTLAYSLIDPLEKSLQKPIFSGGNILSLFNIPKLIPTKFLGSSAAQIPFTAGQITGSESTKMGLRGVLSRSKTKK